MILDGDDASTSGGRCLPSTVLAGDQVAMVPGRPPRAWASCRRTRSPSRALATLASLTRCRERPLTLINDGAVRHTVTVIPDPCCTVIEVVRVAASPGVTTSDVLRWIGVSVAVAGVVLATPDGIASAWLVLKNRRRQAWTAAKRILRRPGRNVGVGGVTAKAMTTAGRGYADVWQPWREEACDPAKIDILHKQVVMLKGRIDEVRNQADRSADELRQEIHKAEGRVTGHVQQLTGELRSQRTQSSRVDARGLGPIALGIILTGLPDELASVEPLGWLIAAVAIIWTVTVFPSWQRDYKQAAEDRSA